MFVFTGTFGPKSELWELSWGKIKVWILCLTFRLFNYTCKTALSMIQFPEVQLHSVR